MPWDLDFPADELTRTAARLAGLGGLRREVRLACRGAAVRWWASTEYAARLDGAWSEPPDRRGLDVQEDADLYGLFTSAVSVIESMTYAAHALGSIRRRSKFPMHTDKQREAVGLRRTAERFAGEYPGHPLTRALTRAMHSPSLRGVRAARNVLTHRATDQRSVVITMTGEWREWTIGESARSDSVILDGAFLRSVLQVTAGHATRIGRGLDTFSGDYFIAPPSARAGGR